jgi:ubiquinone/menaquinone biosynthesis C-methylase UbiE
MGISYGHVEITPDEISKDLLFGWQDETIPEKQRNLVNSQIKDVTEGRPNILFTIISSFLLKTGFDSTSDHILELGCSTGYYYDILKILLKTDLKYTGIDYSEAMIQAARKYNPKIQFVVANGNNLPFVSKSFEYVISGSILLHVADYEQHIKETVRVASKFVFAHRYIVHRQGPTKLLKKMAYDVPVLEVHFNEQHFISLFTKEGVKLVDKIEYITDIEKDEYHLTYVFQR